MRRRLFNLAFNRLGGVAAAVSLVLCVATSFLWAASYRGGSVVRVFHRWHIESSGGSMVVFTGFWTTMDGGYLKTASLVVRVPDGLIVLPTLLLPTIWVLWKRRTGRRDWLARCPTCGYDLRATPQGGRCPECGMAPPAPREPATTAH